MLLDSALAERDPAGQARDPARQASRRVLKLETVRGWPDPAGRAWEWEDVENVTRLRRVLLDLGLPPGPPISLEIEISTFVTAE